jgi:hypothetical protein
MPEDIHESLWRRIKQFIADGHVAMTTEIFDEMVLIDGGLGDFISTLRDTILCEVGIDGWDWRTYITHTNRMQVSYRPFISEFNMNVKGTVGLNDISIICLAKTLGLPLMSMEKKTLMTSAARRKIPDICVLEGIRPLTFSEFCRLEGLRV